MLYSSRNDALGFAARARRNLEYIEEARASGVDVHEVTQIAVSLLGLVVFPWEKNLVQALSTRRLAALYEEGWPKWRFVKGTSETLCELVGHLRNATAHGRITFSSESREPSGVVLRVEDAKSKEAPVDWSTKIQADQLRVFCFRLIDLIEDVLG